MRITLILLLALATVPFRASAQDTTETSNEQTPAAVGFSDLASAIYVVPDLDAAAEWYRLVLGSPPYFEESYYVGFRVGAQELGLVPAEEGDAPGPGGAVPYWRVEDADTALARLLELGAASRYPVTDVGGGVRVATVADPYGNLIGIIETPDVSN